MRVLFMATPVATHIVPLLPLAVALRDAGHDVLVMGQPDIVTAVENAGLDTKVVGDWFHAEDVMRDGLPEGKRPAQVRPPLTPQNMHGFSRGWAAHAKYLVPQYLPLVLGYEPDLIVADPLEYASLLLGAAMGVPVVHHRWGTDPLGDPSRAIARDSFLAGVATRLGVGRLPDPAIIIDPCPPALQVPQAWPAQPIRHVTTADRQPADGAREVTVSLGQHTLGLGGIPLARGILSAFEGLEGVRAVAPISAEYRESIGPVPTNVSMIDPLPLSYSALHPLLARGTAAIHHGGAGTSMAATAFGLPQLVLPQLGDQFAAGEALAAAGAGITIADPARQDDPAQLREALVALLSERSYAVAAQRLRDEMAAMPEPAHVVSVLERLT